MRRTIYETGLIVREHRRVMSVSPVPVSAIDVGNELLLPSCGSWIMSRAYQIFTIRRPCFISASQQIPLEKPLLSQQTPDREFIFSRSQMGISWNGSSSSSSYPARRSFRKICIMSGHLRQRPWSCSVRQVIMTLRIVVNGRRIFVESSELECSRWPTDEDTDDGVEVSWANLC